VYQHFVAVAGATALPVCVYNNPGTTHFTFSPALLGRLADVPNIAAIKMPLPAAKTFAAELAELRSGPAGKLAIGYSGDWGCADALLAGADAWYSVLAGFLPQVAIEIARAAKAGDREKVASLNARLQPLWDLYRAHGGLRVAYAACGELGLIQAKPPRPILPLTQEVRLRVREGLSVLTAAAL
jgi:4-hydroxy-tetrahydrodipicolinate synthase